MNSAAPGGELPDLPAETASAGLLAPGLEAHFLRFLMKTEHGSYQHGQGHGGGEHEYHHGGISLPSVTDEALFGFISRYAKMDEAD